MSGGHDVAARPRLTRALAASPELQDHPIVRVPPPDRLALPVRAVQFGTGAFLRGFLDDLLDAANAQGLFDGRVVAVGSTGSGRDRQLDDQDGLYTVVERGLVDGQPREAIRVVASVSGALSARDEWEAVLALARTPDLAFVFSNTTEVGIALDPEDAYDLGPPRSFPGKLTRFLHERGRAFGFAADRGVVVLPCELIEDNGMRLREIVDALAARWRLEPAFTAWLDAAVPFCNTLVDRIVPGAPVGDDAAALARTLGYDDALVTTCEPYRLFAIEATGALAARLRFAGADPGVVVTDDVRPYRERKVRLLNGAHTALVPAAILAGCTTVREAVEHPRVGRFLRRVLLDEIVPTVDAPGADAFAQAVLDRFANPHVRHALWDITLQGTMKTRVRVVPTIVRATTRTGEPPAALTFALAAFVALARGTVQAGRRAAGLAVPADDQAAALAALWSAHLPALPADVDGTAARANAPNAAALAPFVGTLLGDAARWGTDLAAVPGVADAVTRSLARILAIGADAALAELLATAAPAAPSTLAPITP